MDCVSVRVTKIEHFFPVICELSVTNQRPLYRKKKSQPGFQRSYQVVHESRSWVDLHRQT